MTKPLVVVTGASHGIGRALATAFAAEGHPLLLIARHNEPLDNLPPDRVIQAAINVANFPALESVIRNAEAIHGPTECLVNNAGFLQVGPLQTRPTADMSYEIDVLFKGVVYGIRSVLAGMMARRSGTIINVSSIGDRTAGPDGEVYHASKAAVRSLSASLQKGQAPNNVRVINIAPGFVKTNIHADMGISFDEYCKRLGNPEFITAEELAKIILFCWNLPQRICIRDLVVMPTTSSFA